MTIADEHTIRIGGNLALVAASHAPVRLAKGPRRSGGGGCAMNVVSVYNGDRDVTDYPSCSASPLSRLVHVVNDEWALADGRLSAKESMEVMQLARLTVNTADSDYRVALRWVADLLTATWSVTGGLHADADCVRLCTELAGALTARAADRRISARRVRRLRRLQAKTVAREDFSGVVSAVFAVLMSGTSASLMLAVEQAGEAIMLADKKTRESGHPERNCHHNFAWLAVCSWRDLAGLHSDRGPVPPTMGELVGAARSLMNGSSHAAGAAQ